MHTKGQSAFNALAITYFRNVLKPISKSVLTVINVYVMRLQEPSDKCMFRIGLKTGTTYLVTLGHRNPCFSLSKLFTPFGI